MRSRLQPEFPALSFQYCKRGHQQSCCLHFNQQPHQEAARAAAGWRPAVSAAILRGARRLVTTVDQTQHRFCATFSCFNNYTAVRRNCRHSKSFSPISFSNLRRCFGLGTGASRGKPEAEGSLRICNVHFQLSRWRFAMGIWMELRELFCNSCNGSMPKFLVHLHVMRQYAFLFYFNSFFYVCFNF